MKFLAWSLLLFHLVILIFWIANSGYLFSFFGVPVWIVSIALGLVAYKQIKETAIVKKLIIGSSFFMIFLLLVAALIHFTVKSMP
ncbi:hypothetical protein ACE1TI_17295 [Alteribacillus sp. JSM 102045]|uniref:hypothetical protein n=1 Tax=Alteribacillus sp. JSM 102045 TaxID=1562101 RepID=UPI0035C08557